MKKFEYIVKTYLPSENLCVMYIGANTGQELEYFFKYFKSASIYCFEPLKRTVVVLEKTISNLKEKYSDVDLNIEVINKAVCNTDGDIEIWHDPKSPTHQSATIMPLPHPGDKSHHHIDKMMVKGIKLDTFIQEKKIDKIDLIYADVEGAQGPLIDGADKALQISEHLYIETDGWWGGLNLEGIKERLKDKFSVELRLSHDTFFIRKPLQRSDG